MIRLKSLLTEGSALTSEFLQKIMRWENSIKTGWNSKKNRWFPYGSIEGGTGTIAYGHKLTLNDIDTGRFKNGITQTEAEELLKTDLYSVYNKVKGMIPDYSTFPVNVRQGLLSAAYRGELRSSDKTIKFINDGNWAAAATEYLNRQDYRSGKFPGIKNRMDWNQKQFLTMVNKPTPVKTDSKPAASIKTPKTYTVKSGDSLRSIAVKYKTTVKKIKTDNKLKSDLIKTGQKLSIK